MESTFLSAQATYAHVHIALFKNSFCIDSILMHDARASSHLIPYFDQILKRNNVRLVDLDFIAIDRGPGAFTSLRTAIATVNGISFTRKVPAIGIDGRQALVLDAINTIKTQQAIAQPVTIVTLLNAYNNDVYYSITEVGPATEFKNDLISSGYKKIEELLADLGTNWLSEGMIFVGNGAMLHQELIANTFSNRSIQIIQQETATADSIAHLALEHYQQDSTPCYRIEPNYVKSQYFAIQRPFNVPRI